MAKKASTELPDDMQADWVQALNLPPVPQAKVGGKVNPEHYRIRLAHVNLVAEAAVKRGLAIPFNIEAITKMIEREASMAGLDAISIQDARSEGDKIIAAVTRLLDEGDKDAIFEATDEEIDILIKRMAEVVEDPQRGAESIIWKRMMNTTDVAGLIERDKKKKEEARQRGKKWLNRLRGVKRLREYARHPIPPHRVKECKDNDVLYAAWEATHVIRYMLYIGRSSTLPYKTETGHVTNIYRIGRHHVRFAVDTYEARTGLDYVDGKVKLRGTRPCKGVILIAPPGHGKSEFASHYLALEICLKPTTQALYIHAIADKAQEQKAHVARLFSRDTSAGRRNLSIWPIVLDKTDNNKTKMRVKLPERTKSPTITSTGIMAAQLGVDTNLQILDDIVPQSDVDQPTERKRRFEILSGTFGTRQRGVDTFRVVIGTFWHHDDALSNLWKLSEKSSDLYVNSMQATGGPNTSPPFEPLWPEVFPASDLRRRFEEMNRNISLWSANYQGNPITEESRLIRSLAYYDPDTMDHNEFMASSVFHVSVDPTATNKETADKAGLVYVAVGEVAATTVVDGVATTAYQTRARIIDYKDIRVNQVELADTVAKYTMMRPVFQVHVETRGGYQATADILQNKWGIEAVRHDPGPRAKEQRLKQCAGIIDGSLLGLAPLVEFPGVLMSDGKCGPDNRHKDFYAQFLDFGFAKDDHCVDATTQLLNYLLRSGVLVAGGEAAVSTRLFGLSRNPRMSAELEQYDKPQDSSTKDEETDWAWFRERSE